MKLCTLIIYRTMSKFNLLMEEGFAGKRPGGEISRGGS